MSDRVCSECGQRARRRMVRISNDPVWSEPQWALDCHRDAAVLATTPGFWRAMDYLVRMAISHGDPAELAEKFDPDYYPGVSREDMRDALDYGRRWGRFISEPLPASTGRGLYG